MIPRHNSVAPEKIEIIEARNGKPGALSCATRNRPTTNTSTTPPNSVSPKPRKLASRNGRMLLLGDMDSGTVNLSGTLDVSGRGPGQTGGSIVNDRETYRLLRRRAVTVWLKAKPEDHWNRVLQQGDQRPMAKNPHAMSELRALLAAREKLYSEAEHVVDTSRLDVEAVVGTLAHELGPA